MHINIQTNFSFVRTIHEAHFVSASVRVVRTGALEAQFMQIFCLCVLNRRYYLFFVYVRERERGRKRVSKKFAMYAIRTRRQQ